MKPEVRAFLQAEIDQLNQEIAERQTARNSLLSILKRHHSEPEVLVIEDPKDRDGILLIETHSDGSFEFSANRIDVETLRSFVGSVMLQANSGRMLHFDDFWAILKKVDGTTSKMKASLKVMLDKMARDREITKTKDGQGTFYGP